ncbi:MAG: DUF3137 domain-containing protein [Saprospiraceae bacterium]|nr:DUF3137 domain-containing protein [Saprospiraceae bacterium]
MQNSGKLKRYFNEYIHTELLVFERHRKKLLFFMFLGGVLLGAVSFFVFTLDIFALSVFMFIPWGMLFYFYKFQVQVFTDGFKPIVVKLLLKHMNSRLNYYHKEYISKDTFLRSSIFPMNPDMYRGEDYIMGKIGEIFFELCELQIYHNSNLKGKLQKWFDGIFLHVNFNTSFKGRILMIPKSDRQSFFSVMKSYTKYGGHELIDTGNPEFDQEFIVYIDKGVNYSEMITPELITTVYDYYKKNGKKVYASFYNSHFYMAIKEPKNLLEARMFRSNLNFELIAEYYQELNKFTQLVSDFDYQH